MRLPLAISGLVLVAAAAAAVGLVVSRDDRKPVDWTLLGTRNDGRVLVIGFASTYRPCTRDVRVRAVPSPARDRIDVAVDALVGNCTEQASEYIPPRTVTLERPLRGEPISGAGRTMREVPPAHRRRWKLGTPDLTGLSLADAQAAAGAHGLTVRAARPDVRGVWHDPVRAQRRSGNEIVVVN